jgi:hypothetical protein
VGLGLLWRSKETNKKLLTAVALAAGPLFAAGFASIAMANIELRLTSGAATTGIIVGAGGAASFNGVVGQWNINLTNGLSSGPGISSMDLSSIDATATPNATSLVIELTDNGFTTPNSAWTMEISAHTVSGSGTAQFDAFTDANTLFDRTIPIGTLGPFAAPPGFDHSGTFSATPSTNPYELTEVVTLMAGPNGVQWSTDSSIRPAREPASLTLLGSALIGLGWLTRRRRKTV